MKPTRMHARTSWCFAPMLALAAVGGACAADAPAVKAPTPTLLPDFTVPGGVESRNETVNRTLFNPTRRPAPAQVQEAPKPQMARGQFVLTGTTVVDGKATAFLREVKTGKFRRVAQGDNVNGLTVAEVKSDRVKLAMGDESEDLSLKVVPNPRQTPMAAPTAPVVAGVPPGAVAPVPGALPPGIANAAPQAPQTPEQAAQALLERRRAARAAGEPASAVNNAFPGPAGVPPAAPVPQPAPAPQAQAAQGTSQTTWADVFRRYQERSGSVTGR